MPNNITQSLIYESFSMFHPDGTLMCHCNEKKAKWYVSRGLADWTGEKQFKLRFEPQGHGKSDSPYYTQSLENQCVVCGAKENLNKHHVMPYVFRSRLPVAYKESNHHDIVAICVDCHEEYEGVATQYKAQLAQAAGTSINISIPAEHKNNRKILAAQKLLEKWEKGELTDSKGYKVCLPHEKLSSLRKKAAEPMVEVELVQGAVWANIIMDKVFTEDRLFDFIKSWREHFIAHMNPQYLPEHWSVDHPLEMIGPK